MIEATHLRVFWVGRICVVDQTILPPSWNSFVGTGIQDGPIYAPCLKTHWQATVSQGSLWHHVQVCTHTHRRAHANDIESCLRSDATVDHSKSSTNPAVCGAFGCKFNRNTCVLEPPKLHSWRLQQRHRRGRSFPHQNSCRPRYRARWPCPTMHVPGTCQAGAGKEMNMHGCRAHGLVPKSEELGHAAEALWGFGSQHTRKVT